VLKTVFLIMMENTNWADIKGNDAGAPFINGTLLPMGGHAESYLGPLANFLGVPSTVHTSLENYLWLEAGTNFGLWDNDKDPPANVQTTTQHLADLLENAGVSWGSWQESIDGGSCPLVTAGNYAPKHNPFVYFTDVTDNGDAGAPRCVSHIRPYTEFQAHLTAGTLPRYNFITPNLCDDMHTLCGGPSTTAQGDTWLSQNVPAILSSSQFTQGGVLFILWDESEITLACPTANCAIPMIVLSPFGKTQAGGYSNNIHYDHSSMLRTIQEIFGVTPYLGGAADAGDLSDFFTRFP
jgi:phosphatidylinositol-3-phosphatase